MHSRPENASRRICLLGATGTIGRATLRVLIERGHEVVCLVRPGAEGRVVNFADPASIAQAFEGGRFDAVISCMASRTGAPEDAWAIDHRAHVDVLEAARRAGVGQFVLLSAICVQKPRLAFQYAKLAFEKALIESGIKYSIVRPTAFFKSLSGQIERVRRGRPFLVFGDGRLTSCKPISDGDLANYIVDCLADESRWHQVLPIGGPGAAMTPLEQGEYLFARLGTKPQFKHVPPALLDGIIFALSTVGRVAPALAAKAELARIGRYYATESMLVLNRETGQYEAEATPSTGTETLFDYYDAVLAGTATVAARGDHAVF